MKSLPEFSRRRVMGALTASAAAIQFPVLAQTTPPARVWPTRSVRFVVPFAPGSSTDSLARVFAKVMTEVTGQPVIIDNKGGGNGIPAVQTVLSAPADGYTVFFSSNSTLTTNAATYRKLPYDPIADFAPVSMVASINVAIVVPFASPHKTLADLFADARKRPSALNMGAGSPSYALWGAWLSEIAGVKTTNVMYKGVGEVVIAIGGNQIDYAVIDVVQANEMSRGGRLRILAVTGDQRSANMPNVPTTGEAGFAGFNATAWCAVVVSAKTPQPVVQEIVRVFAAISDTQEAQAYVDKVAMKRMTSGPEYMRTFQLEEIARWKRLIATTGIQME